MRNDSIDKLRKAHDALSKLLADDEASEWLNKTDGLLEKVNELERELYLARAGAVMELRKGEELP